MRSDQRTKRIIEALTDFARNSLAVDDLKRLLHRRAEGPRCPACGGHHEVETNVGNLYPDLVFLQFGIRIPVDEW